MNKVLLLFVSYCVLAPTLGYAKDFSRVYKKVSATVVLIETNRYIERKTGKGLIQTQQEGLGSGVIVKNNYVLTAAHVVNVADRIQVRTHNGKVYAAKTISSIPLADLAVIEIIDSPKPLLFARLGDSDSIDIGAEVFVVGAPYGLSQTLTVGHLSGRRTTTAKDTLIATEFLQTDAPINQGNSGGPMFNSKGEVVGIVSHIRSSSGGSEGLGFAASINMAKKLFLNNPPIWIGMEFVPLSATLAEALNTPYSGAILVQQVAYGSLADEFGVQSGRIPAVIAEQKLMLGGDIIIAFGNVPVSLTPKGIERTRDYINGVKAGGKLELTVYRNGKSVVLTTTKRVADKH